MRGPARARRQRLRCRSRSYETTNDKSLTASPQHRVGGRLFQHALGIADATVILVERGLPCPALALARPLIESWTRGVWASRCAGDQEIEAFLVTGRPGPWRLEKLAQCVKDRIPAESEWLEETMGRPEVMSMLHDLTHGGRWQVQYRVGEEAIEPKVPVGMQVALLELGNEIREKCVTQLHEMMEDESTVERPGDKP